MINAVLSRFLLLLHGVSSGNCARTCIEYKAANNRQGVIFHFVIWGETLNFHPRNKSVA